MKFDLSDENHDGTTTKGVAQSKMRMASLYPNRQTNKVIQECFRVVKDEFKQEIFFQNGEYIRKDPKAEIFSLPRLAEDRKIARIHTKLECSTDYKQLINDQRYYYFLSVYCK